MIRLKSLLEQTLNNREITNTKTDIQNVLFLGDAYTKSKSSYAYRLIKSHVVNGKVIAWPNINMKQLIKLTKRYMNDKYSIVSVMFGDIVKKAENLDKFKIQLSEFQQIATAYGAKLVIIQNPKTPYLQYNEYLNAINDISHDMTIGVNNELQNSQVQSSIAEKWINTVNSSLNLNISNPVTDTKLDIKSNDVNKKTTPETDDTDTTSSNHTIAKQTSIPGNAASFIDKWKSVAQQHENKYGIPASITLAQGGIESAWGGSYLARSGNNFFGIKCHSWSGDKIYANDDLQGECFRKYPSADQSFEDHALFLKNNGRYGSLFSSNDYVSWANGLKAAGYATSPTYASALISTIEHYGLYKYDKKYQQPT